MIYQEVIEYGNFQFACVVIIEEVPIKYNPALK